MHDHTLFTHGVFKNTTSLTPGPCGGSDNNNLCIRVSMVANGGSPVAFPSQHRSVPPDQTQQTRKARRTTQSNPKESQAELWVSLPETRCAPLTCPLQRSGAAAVRSQEEAPALSDPTQQPPIRNHQWNWPLGDSAKGHPEGPADSNAHAHTNRVSLRLYYKKGDGDGWAYNDPRWSTQ